MSDPLGSKRPKDSAFRQQNLKAWRPILTPKLVILLFLGVGCVFVPIGIAVIVASNSVTEVDSPDYSRHCCISNCDDTSGRRVDRNPCFVNITIPNRMEPPIYMYYKLTNFYQNHRRYVKSRSDMQLRGLEETSTALETSCQHRVFADGNQSKEARIISPCGLIAWSTFNDSFTLLDVGGAPVGSVSESGIAWESDVSVKFKNAEAGDGTVKTGANFPHFAHERNSPCESFPGMDNTSELFATCKATNAGWCFRGSGMCAEDEHFVVWMRTAGLPTFRKLYARIDTPLDPGIYTVRVHNGRNYTQGGAEYFYNPAESAAYYTDPTSSAQPVQQTALYPVHTFGGTKAVVLSTSSWIGGKNGFLGSAYLTVGIICMVLAAGFAIKQRFFPR